MIIYTYIVQYQFKYIYMSMHEITKITHILFCDSYVYMHFILRKTKMETLYKPNSTMAYSTFDIIHTIKTLYFYLPMGMSGLEKRKNYG